MNAPDTEAEKVNRQVIEQQSKQDEIYAKKQEDRTKAMEEIKKWRQDYIQIKDTQKQAEQRKRIADELALNEKIATLDDMEKFRE